MDEKTIDILENILRLIRKVRHSTCMSNEDSQSYENTLKYTENLIENLKKEKK